MKKFTVPADAISKQINRSTLNQLRDLQHSTPDTVYQDNNNNKPCGQMALEYLIQLSDKKRNSR